MRPYPDDPIGPFDPPPSQFTDADDRLVTLHAVATADNSSAGDAPADGSSAGDAPADDSPASDASDTSDAGVGSDTSGSIGDDDTLTPSTTRERLQTMYKAFDPADRAQGIPPTGTARIERWLGDIVTDETYNVVACHEERAVGHATLVPSDDGYELAIFVLDTYQGAGIGTELLRALLGFGASNGVERVWLSVERWNRHAVSLYEKLGFETSDTQPFEIEMAARLATPQC